MREEVQKVQVEENILDYLLALVERSRQHRDLSLGASPRSAVAWLQAAKAHAWLLGNNYVTPDDVKSVAFPGLGTGVGRVGFYTCAKQVREAVREFALEKHLFPTSWVDAQSKHQKLYTDRLRDLQFD